MNKPPPRFNKQSLSVSLSNEIFFCIYLPTCIPT